MLGNVGDFYGSRFCIACSFCLLGDFGIVSLVVGGVSFEVSE